MHCVILRVQLSGGLFLNRLILWQNPGVGIWGLPNWRPGGINDRSTFATFTRHLIIAFLDEVVCIGD